MPRNMSFALTTRQARERTKTVTHRVGWWHLQPGDVFQQVVKGMGLKKGEKVERLHLCRVVSVKHYPLSDFAESDCAPEGFPGWTAEQFINFFAASHGCNRAATVNRIEFEYLD